MTLKQDKFRTLISMHMTVKFQKIKSKEENLKSRLGCKRRKQKEDRLLNTRSGNEKMVNVFIYWKKSKANVELCTWEEDLSETVIDEAVHMKTGRRGCWKTFIQENSERYLLGVKRK